MPMLKILALFGMTFCLTSCIYASGRFVSSLDIRNDGTFSFSYKGEIILETPEGQQSSSQNMKVWDDKRAFCGVDAQNVARQCSAEEIDALRFEWEAEQKLYGTKLDSDSAEIIRIFGIDPRSESSFQPFVDELKKQKGWKKVSYLGKGVFDVEYAISGRLDHDFMFPVFPKFSMLDTFVIIRVGQSDTLHIATPGLAGGSTRALAALVGNKSMSNDIPKTWRTFGVFTLTTDATIKSQNSGSVVVEEAGGSPGVSNRKVSWTINETATQPADAWIKLK